MAHGGYASALAMDLNRIVVFALALTARLVSSQTQTVSIAADSSYLIQRACVQTCLWAANAYWVGGQIGCGAPYYNACFCNANFGASATSYVSSCASKLCGDGADASTAVVVYADYCAGAGFALPGYVPASATTTLASVTLVSVTPKPTIFFTSPMGTTQFSSSVLIAVPTAQPSSNPPTSGGSSSPNSGNPTVSTVEIVVPIVAALTAAVLIAFFYFRWKQTRLQLQLGATNPQLPPPLPPYSRGP